MKLAYFLLAFCFILVSCEKQRLNDATHAISDTWQVVKYEINGSEQTDYFLSVYTDYRITFSENGSFTEQYYNFGSAVVINGTWLLQNNVNELKLVDSTGTRIYDIIELNGARLTIELTGFTDVEVFYLE
jgi:hypothetical protein